MRIYGNKTALKGMETALEPRLSGVRHVHVDGEQAGRRVDNFLFGLLKDVPKSRVYRMLRTGEVRINGRRAKPETRLAVDDRVRIPPVHVENTAPRAHGTGATPLPVTVLHEDPGLLVIDKPAGMAVHGGSGIRLGAIELLRRQRPECAYLELAHRLDRDTSGCLMIAKKPSILRLLHEQLRSGRIEKRYLALVRGAWQGGERTVRAPLLKNILAGGERRVSVSRDGKESVSHFAPIQVFPQATLVEVLLETGRTHQIRVHAAHIGHPIAGDGKYGDVKFNRDMKLRGLRRLFLHAERLHLPAPRPDERSLEFHAPLPQELNAVLNELKTGVQF
ncbi:MAG TPA: RluA family pseudouridine synthase [Gammaproteobacteria bacterium]|nr:RluA family pseudouridine synthase [Gammaproteobacteria bacterium]